MRCAAVGFVCGVRLRPGRGQKVRELEAMISQAVIANPEYVELTVSLNGTVGQFKQLRAALAAGYQNTSWHEGGETCAEARNLFDQAIAAVTDREIFRSEPKS